MTIELNDDYPVWQVECPQDHIISQSQDFQHWSCSLYKFQKTWSASFHTHINLGWLCNLRFDYSQTFEGFAWLHVVLTDPSMPSQGELIHSVLIPKSWLSEHKRSSIKFLYFFVLSSTTVRRVNQFFIICGWFALRQKTSIVWTWYKRLV